MTHPVIRDVELHANRDPISRMPGSHPVGTGLGAAAGGMLAGAAAGAAAGPLGSLLGAVIGAVAGGFVGKGVAELVRPTAEAAYTVEMPQRPREHHVYLRRGAVVGL